MPKPSIRKIDAELVLRYAEYLKSAEAGDADAQCELGLFLHNGTGVNADLVEAARWFYKAAEQGHTEAQFYLGICFRNGDGVKKNLAETARLYREAAKKDHLEAQFNLGYLLHTEIGNEHSKELEEAVHWYKTAAAKGHIGAISNLGACFQHGLGIGKRDQEQAINCYRDASAKGNPNAQCNLGLCLESGEGVAKDEAQAVRYYQESANQGFAIAQFHLGLCLEEGIGIEQNLKEAFDWYRKAAEQAVGVEYDLDKPVSWHYKDSKAFADAQCKLGVFLENGIGVERDSSGSILWYCRAALRGQESAKENLTKKPPYYMIDYGMSFRSQKETAQNEFKLFGLGFRKDDKNTPLTKEEIIEVINGMKSVGRARSDESRVIGDLVVFSFSKGVITSEADLNEILANLLVENPTINHEKSQSCLMIKDCIKRLNSLTSAPYRALTTSSSASNHLETESLTPPSFIFEAEITPRMFTDKEVHRLLVERGALMLLTDREAQRLLIDGVAAEESPSTASAEAELSFDRGDTSAAFALNLSAAEEPSASDLTLDTTIASLDTAIASLDTARASLDTAASPVTITTDKATEESSPARSEANLSFRNIATAASVSNLSEATEEAPSAAAADSETASTAASSTITTKPPSSTRWLPGDGNRWKPTTNIATASSAAAAPSTKRTIITATKGSVANRYIAAISGVSAPVATAASIPPSGNVSPGTTDTLAKDTGHSRPK